MVTSSKTKQQPKQELIKKDSWDVFNLEVINIIQQEAEIFSSIKVFKLDGTEVIEQDSLVTAIVENSNNIQKYCISNINIGIKNNGNN